MPSKITKPERLRDSSWILCGVCGGENDSGFGYAPNESSRILWACQECIGIAKGVYGMAGAEKTKYACTARDIAGEKAGEYLESINQFDLSQLTQEQYRQFLDTFRLEWSAQMRRQLIDCAPPF